jgi:hypothetical protein
MLCDYGPKEEYICLRSLKVTCFNTQYPCRSALKLPRLFSFEEGAIVTYVWSHEHCSRSITIPYLAVPRMLFYCYAATKFKSMTISRFCQNFPWHSSITGSQPRVLYVEFRIAFSIYRRLKDPAYSRKTIPGISLDH